MSIKKNIKLSMLFFVGLFCYKQTMGQQEPQYTQFMYNKLPMNAGYTGAREVLSIRALYRNQWTGIDGAPKTTSISIHSPFKREHFALGGFIVNDRLGVTNQTWVDLTYAYRINLNQKTKLSIGINGGMLFYKSNITELDPNDPNDPAYTENIQKILPDFGGGLYIYQPMFYVGIGVPNMIKSDISNNQDLVNNSNIAAHRSPHFFIMGGGVIPINDAFKIRPQYMGKTIFSKEQHAPWQNDFNLSFLIIDRVNIGASYRTAFGNKNNGQQLTNFDSFDANLEVWPTKQLMIGYAYDHTLTKLGNYNKGSHEIILGYDVTKKIKKVDTPRYF